MATTLGAEIRRLRLANGMSQAALAAEVGVRGETVSRWERGQYPVDDRHQARLERAFNLPAGSVAKVAAKGGKLTPRTVPDHDHSPALDAAVERLAAAVLELTQAQQQLDERLASVERQLSAG